MKKTRHTEEQIAFALKQAETGTSVAEASASSGRYRIAGVILSIVVGS